MTSVDLPTIRQSHLARADGCLLSLKLERDAGRVTTLPMARGTVFHLFVSTALTLLIGRGEYSMGEDEARNLMGSLIDASDLPIGSHEHADLIHLAGEFVRDRGFPIGDIIDAEETYAVEVDGWRVTGKPDMVLVRDNQIEIYDWKTSWAIDPESAVAGSFQLRLYARMAAEQYPYIDRFRLVMEYPRWHDAGFREATLDRAEIARIDGHLRALLQRVARAEQSGDWAATPGPWCQTCALPERCPVPLECRADGEVTDAALALAYAEQITTMEAVLRKRKKALKAWSGEHGPIRRDQVEFSFQTKADSEQCRDKGALRVAMADAGIDWSEHFKTVKGSAEFRARKVKAES